MRRLPVLALITTLLLTFGAGRASAATAVLTVASLGGPAVAPGDTLNGSGTFRLCSAPGGGGTCITCHVGVSMTDTTNPPAPGTAMLSMFSISFANCSSSSIQSLTLDNLPYRVAIDSSGTVTISGAGTSPIQLTMGQTTPLGLITCVYRAVNGVVTGRFSNTDNSITITDAPLNKASGPALCAASQYLTMKLAPIQDGLQPVYLNG